MASTGHTDHSETTSLSSAKLPVGSSEALHNAQHDSEKQSIPAQDSTEYPSGKKLFLIVLAMMVSMFLVALDKTIIATAIPAITNDFSSLGDIGWYGASYQICSAAFMLVIGRVYTFYSPKWVFLSSIMLFEVGSAVCGAAPNSVAFILGRAIAGLGTAGTMSGNMIIIVHSVPLHKRPMYTGLFGALFGVASVAGPLLGGVFTDKLSWRWCFYINLPLGGLAILIISSILKFPTKRSTTTTKQNFLRLDPVGTALFLPSMVCLLLALQWGGTTYAWSTWRIIFLLVLAFVLLGGFILVQFLNKANATVSPRFLAQRSVASGVVYSFLTAAHMMMLVYYLPLWFQAIRGESAVDSGLLTLAMLLPLFIGSVVAGMGVRFGGYYVPWMILSTVLCSIGAGLISTFTTTTPRSHWLGFQVIYGFGLGMGMQQASVAVQTVLAKPDVPTGIALVFFARELGGAVFLSVGQNLFFVDLAKQLAKIPGLDLSTDVGATELRKFVPAGLLGKVLDAYNGAIVKTFLASAGLAAATVVGIVFMEWRSVKNGEEEKTLQEKGDMAKSNVEKADAEKA